jgi:D-aspartate ligase
MGGGNPIGDRPVVVLGLMLAGLALVRSLGRTGLCVTGIALDGDDLGLRSRYLRRRYVVKGDEVGDRDAEILGVLRKVAARGRPVLFPERDEPVSFVLRCWEEVQEIADLPLPPDADTILRLRLKDRLAIEAAKAAVPTPRTAPTADEQALLEAALNPPLLVKPVERSEEFAVALGSKAISASDLDQAIAVARRARRRGFPTIVQEFVPISHDGVSSLLAYIARDGRPLVALTGRRLSAEPLLVGTSAVFTLADEPRVRELGLRLLASVDYRGIAHIEFAHDPRDDDFKLLEVNTRVPIWAGVAMTRDLDLAGIVYDDLCDRATNSSVVPRDGVCWTYLPKDLWASLQLARRGELGARDFLSPYLRAKRVRAVVAADDPLPALTSLKYFWTKARLRASQKRDLHTADRA